MKSLRVLVVLGLLAASPGLVGQSGLSPEALLKAAISLEVVDGDISGAIAQYKEIALTYASNHPVAAGALLRLADLFERLGEPDARATYQQIVKEYPDVGAAASTARTRLLKIQQADAGPFRTRSINSYFDGTGFPARSPDGKFAAYTRPLAGKTVTMDGIAEPVHVLSVRDLNSGEERVLVEPKDSILGVRAVMVWSPDSRHLAYAVRVANGRREGRIVTVSTRETRKLGPGPSWLAQNFSWSPNSQHLLFGTKASREAPFELRLLTLVSNRTSTIGQSPSWSGIAWSADSTKLAHLPSGPNGNVIRLVSLAGEELRMIAIPALGPNGQTTVTRWTEDDRILFTQNVDGGNDSFAIPSAGGEPRKICEGRASSGGDGCQGYSPDGRLQIVRKNVSGGGRIVLRNTATGEERPLTPEAVSEQTVIGFSPDGRLFAFRSNRDGPWAVYVVPTDQIPVANPVKVTPLESAISAAGGWWTPRGLVLRVDDAQTNLYRLEMDPRTGRATGPPIRLTERTPTNRDPFVSPNGQRIAHIARDAGQAGFAVMDANGSGERLVQAVPPDRLGRMRLIGWHSADDLLISDAGPGTGPTRNVPKTLKTLNIRTSEITVLPGPPFNGNVMLFAPRDGTLFFSRRDISFLIRRPLAGDAEDHTTLHADWSQTMVSPDGRLIAYTTADYGPDGRKTPVPGDIRLRQRGGTEDKILARYTDSNDGIHSPRAFSADGRYLIYWDPAGMVRVVNVDTTESWPLLAEKLPGVDFQWADTDWSPTGTFIVLGGSTSRTNWRAIDGVTYDAVTKILKQR